MRSSDIPRPGLALLALLLTLSPVLRAAPDGGDPSRYDVIWDAAGRGPADSMPVGNGDVGLNVWVEKDGDLLFYVAKADAVSETSEFLKLGRVRVRLTPALAGDGVPFRQELRLREGEVVVTAGKGEAARTVRVWVDANRPRAHVEAAGAAPFGLEARLELWRDRPRTIDPKSPEMSGNYEMKGSPAPVVLDPDTVLPARDDRLVWCHRNERSIYGDVLRVQHLESLAGKYPDPLLHRTSGCRMSGAGLVAADDHTLRSAGPAASHRLTLTALTAQTETVQRWREQLDALSAAHDAVDIEAARRAHADWWRAFWDRSWVHVTGSKQAGTVSSGYALQRWVEACGGRGSLPMKFNGSLFTVGRSFPDPAPDPAPGPNPDGVGKDKAKQIDVPDWRAWGSNYWFQNQRHLYWPLLASGDYDLMAPWFRMYTDALPLAADKTRLYYGHEGACFQETIFFWGLTNNGNFGWDNPGVETTNRYIRWYWSGGIEMTAMMLDRYEYTQDPPFAREALVPFADAVTTFYDLHWKRDAHGKIRFDPAQSLETWQKAVNPLPEVAGLRYVLPRLLALPADLTTAARREAWAKTLADLPPVPVAPGADGKPALQPAEEFAEKHNVENAELYAVYPYRLYGVGKPGLELARHTFAVRRFKGPTCWSQDPMDAALLGLTDEAKAAVVANFSASGAKFQAFWRPGHDWIPDLDNGGAGMQALQWMLVQCDGRRIRLLPAWPADWDAEFKLNAPYRTTLEGAVRGGKVVGLKVTPEDRRRDVVVGDEPVRDQGIGG